MKRTIVSGIMLALLFGATLKLGFNIQPVKAWSGGTIYIKADGSIDPPAAPIQRVGDVYTFIANIYDSIMVERDNIVIDGASYIIQGTGALISKGISLSGRSNVTVKGMEIIRWDFGIELSGSSRNIISENKITENRLGIALYYDSSNNTVYRNNITDNSSGLKIFVSSNNSVIGNNMTENIGPPKGVGLSIEDSANNAIVGNNITGNSFGIFIEESTNNTLRNNAMVHNKANLRVTGVKLSDFVNYVDSSNTVDGKPVYYVANEKNKQIPADAGYVGAVNCEDILVKGQNLSNGGELMFAYTTKSTIEDVNIFNNFIGMYLFFSSGNVISHSNFINNTSHVWSYNSRNTWDRGYPFGGNYWSYYTGLDLHSGPYQNDVGSDGIGDTPLVISANNTDHYPLIQPYDGSVRNLNKGRSYPTIQGAINNAMEGDKIFVLSGTYYEHVVLNKSLLLVGENMDTTIIDGNGTGNVVLVEENDTTITGFALGDGNNGLSIQSFNSTIIGNMILNNTYHGVDLVGRNNSISGNTIMNNRYGVILGASSYNIISQNEIVYNQAGINICEDCEKNSIRENKLINNTIGIGIVGNNNSVTGNTIEENWSGIEIAGINNTIYHNNFVNNTYQVLNPFNNTWDNGCEGNYWSDYNGADLDDDGVGDTYIPWQSVDNYPLNNRYWNPADINHDFKVDIKDIAPAAKAFGSYLIHPLWNPHADTTGPAYLEPDGKVDIRDIALAAKNFGKTYL